MAAEDLGSPDKSTSTLPEVMAGRYRIERLLGAGGMGAVYQARDLLHEQFGEPDSRVAIKVLNAELAHTADAGTLLYREFALTRQLHHPHILRIHAFDVDVASGGAFLVQDLMRGLTLDCLMHERPEGLPWHELQSIAVALLDALGHAHQRGVLHGDVKPGNIMLTEQGLRLFDFGLAHPLEGVQAGLPQLHPNGLRAWTPRYTAPERCDGASLTEKAEVYAVACVLYELASGEHPFGLATDVSVGKPRSDRRLEKPESLPMACWATLRIALASDPRDRAASIDQLCALFRAAPAARSMRWF